MKCICIHCIGWLLNQLLFRLLGRDLSYQIGKKNKQGRGEQS